MNSLWKLLPIAILFPFALRAEDPKPSAGPPTLLFSANYNAQTEKADFAKGRPESLNFKRSLQFGHLMGGVVKSGFWTIANERCDYEMMGNFDPRAGTLSLWVCPFNWRPADKRSVVLFAAEIPGKYRLLLFKPAESPDLMLEVATLGTGGEKHVVKCPAAHWPVKEWHKVDAAWSAQGLKLYVDGDLAGEEGQETRPKDGAYRFPAPEKGGVLSVVPNNYFKGPPTSSPEDLTMVDELQIFDGALGANDVQKKYAEVRQSLSGGVYRKPLVTVPRSRLAVKLDGKISAGEWDEASRVPIEQLRGQKLLADHHGVVLIKYDDQNLYLGFHASGETEPIAKATQRDGNVWEDGAFEVVLGCGEKNRMQFIINSVNAVFDILNGDRNWNGGKPTAAGRDGDGWSAEVALAFKELGVEPPKPGSRWAGNFMHDWDQQRGGYATWGLTADFGNLGSFGALVFGGESPGLRVELPGNPSTGKVGVSVGLGSGPAPAGDQVRCSLIAEGAPAQPTVKPLKAGENATFEVIAPGGKESLLSVTAVDSSGAELLIYDQCFTVKPPLEMAYRCWPQKRKLDVDLDLGNLDAKSAALLGRGGFKGQVALISGSKPSALSSTAVSPKTAKTTWELPFPKELPVGQYEVRVSLVTADGQRYEQKQPFEVPPDDFIKARSGIDHTVPEPWTPVQCQEGRLGILDREYLLGKSPWPVKMTSLGRPVLEQPVRWIVVTADGEKEMQWDRPKLKEKFEDEVHLEGKGRLDNGKIKASYQARLEFDGQWLTTVVLEPGPQPVEIKSMRLEYAVPLESADYLLAPLVRPWKEDRILLDIFDKIDAGGDVSHTPTGSFWLTGLKTGLFFFTPTDGNWVYQPDKPNVRVVRGPKQAEVMVLLIHKPVKLEKAATYTLGLTATPTKRQPPRSWNSGEHHWIFQNGKWRSWISLVPGDPECLRRDLEAKKQKGTRFFYQYSCAGVITGDHAYEQYWGPTWGAVGQNSGGASEGDFVTFCVNSGGRELVIWQVENLARDFHVGPYFDMSGLAWCGNEAHGCGYTDSFGHKARSTQHLGFRDELKRIYKVAHKHGCWTFNHNHSMFRIAVHTFTDLWLPGEQYTTAMTGQWDHFYTQKVPRTDYLVEMNPFIHGATMVFIPEYGRSSEMAGEPDFERWGKEPYAWAAERLLTMLLPHDITYIGAYMCPKPGERVTEIFRQKGIVNRIDESRPAAVFTGYWDSPKIAVANPELLLSYYTVPKEPRVVAILSNPTLTEQVAKVKIRPEDFGLRAPLVFRDEYRGEDLKGWQGEGIRMPPESFRILNISGAITKPQ